MCRICFQVDIWFINRPLVVTIKLGFATLSRTTASLIPRPRATLRPRLMFVYLTFYLQLNVVLHT